MTSRSFGRDRLGSAFGQVGLLAALGEAEQSAGGIAHDHVSVGVPANYGRTEPLGPLGVGGKSVAGETDQESSSHSDRHSGRTDTGGTGDCSDPAVAERLGLRPCQQATLPLVKVRKNRLERGCQHGPLPIQPAHARPTNHRTESYESKICTPSVPVSGQAVSAVRKVVAIRSIASFPDDTGPVWVK